MLIDFLRCESGAVTVDYVVLTAAMTGIGVGVTSTVSPGIQSLAERMQNELSGAALWQGYQDALVTESNAFNFNADGWSGATHASVDGFGGILGPFAGSEGLEAVTTTFDVPTEATEASVMLDLLAMDDLDGEEARVYIDGQVVGRVSSTDGVLSFLSEPGLEGITISADIRKDGTNIGGLSSDEAHLDGIARLMITVDNPTDTLSLGIGSTADEAIENESFGLDNVVFSAV